MDVLVRNAWLVPFFPLLGGLIAAVGGKWLKGGRTCPVVARDRAGVPGLARPALLGRARARSREADADRVADHHRA